MNLKSLFTVCMLWLIFSSHGVASNSFTASANFGYRGMGQVELSYITQDNSTSDISELTNLSVYYVDPESQEEIILFESDFENGLSTNMNASSDITWDQSQLRVNDLYQYLHWDFPNECIGKTIDIKFYATWSVNGTVDSTSYNPLVIQSDIPEIQVDFYSNEDYYSSYKSYFSAGYNYPIDSWKWEIEGLEPSFEENPTFTFSSVGTFDLSITITSRGLTKTFIFEDEIVVNYAASNKFTFKISERNDSLLFRYLVVNNNNSDVYSALSKIRTYYIDPETQEEVFLFGGEFDGDLPYIRDSISEVSFCGSLESGSYIYYENAWKNPLDLNGQEISFNTYVTWYYQGAENTSRYNPLVTKYTSSSVTMTSSQNATVGVPYYLKATSKNVSYSYCWYVDGGRYYNNTPKITFDKAGTYDIVLQLYKNGYLKNTLRYPQYVTVVPASPLVLNTSFPDTISPFTPFSSQLTTELAIGDVEFSASNLPEGAVLDPLSGLFSWPDPIPGNYHFTVKASDDKVTLSQSITITVSASYSNVDFHIQSKSGDDLENALIKIDTTGSHQYLTFKTDASGMSALAKLQYGKSYPLTVVYSDWPIYTTDIKVKKDSTYTFGISEFNLVLQGLAFHANKISETNGIYRLTGNININELLFFEGDSYLMIDNRNDKLPGFYTTNNLKVKGGVIDKELLPAGAQKDFYFYQGMIIPKSHDVSFDAGTICKLPLNGCIMSFYDEGVEFATFPELPWIIGDYIMDAGYYFMDQTIALIRAGNLDLSSTLDAASEIGGDISTVADTIINREQGSMDELFSKFDGLSINMPSIEVVKYLDINKGETLDFSIEDLSVCKNGIGLDGFSANYHGLSDYFECEAHLTWGSDSDDDFRATRSLDALKQTLSDSFEETVEMKSVTVEIQDENGHVIYHSSYGEFVDISDQIAAQELEERDLPISGFGVEFAIKAGKIDKIILSVDTSIPIASTPFEITNIKGGVEGLTNTKNGITSYSTKNMIVSAGCDIEDVSPTGIIAFRDVTLSVQPFSYFAGSGELEVAEQNIASGGFSYDNDIKTFKVGVAVDVYHSTFSGNANLSITSKSLSGLASLKVKTPSDLPYAFNWAESKSIASATVGFDNEQVGANITLGKEVEEIEYVEERWGFHPIKTVKKATKSVAKTVVNGVEYAAEKTVDGVTYVAKKVVKIMDVDFSIGYNFKNNKVSFGDNVVIPKIARKCYRGDSLIQEFNITDDTQLMYITVSNNGVDYVDFELYNTENQLVKDDAVWCRDTTLKEIIAIVPHPAIGTWTVKTDTTLFQNVSVSPMFIDNKPQGVFVSPNSIDTTETEIMVQFNDTNDTLAVTIYVDDDLEDFDGTPITDFNIMNNASIKFTYKPNDLKPGNYHFYYSLSDGKNGSDYQYAKGTLVIPEGTLPTPLAVKNEMSDSTFTIYWDVPDSNLVDYVTIELVDKLNGNKYQRDIPDDSMVVFDNLSHSHRYDYSVRNRNFETETSTAITGSVYYLSTTTNNPPTWNMVSGKTYEIFEMDSINMSFEVNDPEGDIVNISVIEPLAKTMSVSNNEFNWSTLYGDKGLYEFHAVADDGNNKDTLIFNILVKAAQEQNITLSFASNKLYEQDNMFLLLNDPLSTDSTKTAWLYNFSKKDSVKVDMERKNETTYQGYFQLSYQRRSILSVSEGDTLIAAYYLPSDTVLAFAVFDSIPQISDNIAPLAITDMEATYLNDQIQLVFTVPEDRLDNNMLANPWKYDLRYAYQTLDNETTYLGAYALDGFSVGKIGTKDTLLIDVDDLFDMDNYHRVWFNIKAGDTKFNYGEMSNTAYVDYVINPENLVAANSTDFSIQLNWNGPSKLDNDDYFDQYEVYRKVNDGDYYLIGRTDSTTFNDVPGNEVSDGIFNYSLKGIYTDAVTTEIFSNTVDFDKYSDIVIQCIDSTTNQRIDNNFVITIDPQIYMESMLTNTDSTGIAYFRNIINQNYEIAIAFNDTIYQTDSIEVKAGSTNFEFIIYDLYCSIDTTEEVTICKGMDYEGHTESETFIRTLVSTKGCDSVITTVLTVQEMTQPTITQEGDKLTSSASAGNQWYYNQEILEGENQQILDATQSGTYTVQIQSEEGCMSDFSEELNVTLVGIDEMTYQISVFPNPSSGIVNVQGLPQNEVTTIAVFNDQGQKLMVIEERKSATSIDLSSYPKGNYFISLNGNIQKTIKIVKE